ncbi:hypothetical protein E2C01_087270 [Portunus trituberculatus]|uniref:Uncharacterized protein n=1 Tax=Portunus trituberculatus TaxID=210409 RepID=A0A5B7JDM0_PORTR|nr:hypothetical protein [Portunus trituberculatus]
MISGRITAPW